MDKEQARKEKFKLAITSTFKVISGKEKIEINFEDKNLTNKPIASTVPVNPIKKLAPVSVNTPEINKDKEKIPRIRYVCLPDNLNNEVKIFMGQTTGNISKNIRTLFFKCF